MRGNAVTAILEPPPKSPTLGDLHNRFGDMPAWRIRFQPYPATVEDLIELQNRESRLFELVDGFLVEKVMGLRESLVAAAIVEYLRAYVNPRRLGFVTSPDGMMTVLPGVIYEPDVAFIRREQMPNGVGAAAAPEVYPDLAVEVLSPGNTKREMAEKRRGYFEAGTSVVWMVDPATRTVAIHLPEDPENPRLVSEDETIAGDPVLPGFAVQVAKFFEDVAR